MIRRIAVTSLACGFVLLAGAVPSRAQGFHAVFTQDGLDIWAVGDAGLIYRSTSSGQDYISQTVGSAPLRGVAANGITALLVSDAGVVRHSTNSGGTWDLQTLSGTPDLKGVAMPSPTAAYVVGSGGAIFKSVDGGASWSPQTSGTAATLWGVRFIDADNGWAVGDNGTILATHDGGANWSPASVGTTNRFRAIDQSGLTVWAVGDRGTCWRSLNGGGAWTPVNLKLDARSDVRGIRVVTPDNIWIAGGGGFVRKSTDGGATWTFLQHRMHGALSSLAVFGSKAWMASYKNKMVFRTVDSGTTWTMPGAGSMAQTFIQTFIGPGAVRGSTLLISPADEKTFYCAMNASLYISRDEGNSFQFLHSFPAGTQKINSFVVSPKDTNLMGALIGGSISDRFVRSTDGGATWNATPPMIHDFGEYGIPLEMHPDKPDTLFFGGDSDTLMRSTDFGATWHTACIDSAFRSPCDIVVVPDNNDVILVGDGITGSLSPPGQYYKSTDGGGKFELMATRPSGQGASEIPGMACTRLRNSAVFGTNWSGGGVQRTLDFGTTWPVVHNATQAWGVDIGKDDPNFAIFGQYSGSVVYITLDGGASWTQTPAISGFGSNYSFYARDRDLVLAEQSGGVWKMQTTYSFTPATAQIVNVVAPNGGESWPGGSVRLIRWSQTNIPLVKIELRMTPLDSWQLVAFANGASGSYSWTLPNVVTDQAAIRVSDGWDAAPGDESDLEFTIATPLIQATPTPIDFGSLAKGGEVTLPVTVENPGSGNLSVSAVTTSNDGFTEGRTTITIFPGQSDTIGVTFRPAAGVSYAGTLDIASNAYGSPLVSIPLTGLGLAPMFAALPDPIEFPDMLAGGPAQDTIHIENAGTAPLNISSVSSSSPEFYTGRTSFTIPAGGSDTLLIVYTPWDAGLDTSIVSIVADDTVEAHSITVHGQAHTNNVAVNSVPPTAFRLSQNQPNPFRRGTAIRYALPQAADVTLEVFNLQGQRVATLVREFQSPGWYTVPFGAGVAGAGGERLAEMPSGVYFYRLRAGAFAHTKKMLFVR